MKYRISAPIRVACAGGHPAPTIAPNTASATRSPAGRRPGPRARTGTMCGCAARAAR